MASELPPALTTDRPGAGLKALRTRKGLTLVQLSERTGLPVSTLSKLENDKMSLTFDKLLKLAGGMGVDVAELVSPRTQEASESQPVSGRRSMSGPNHARVIETPNSRHTYLAADLLNKKFVPIYGEVRCRSIEQFGDLVRHPGEEFIYVLQGAIDVYTEHYAPMRLNVGESLYFDSSMAHAYVAAAPGPCAILSINSAEPAELMSAFPPAPGTAGDSPRRRTALRGRRRGS